MPPVSPVEFVTSRKRQFVHVRARGEANSMCRAMPGYYGADSFIEVQPQDVDKYHKCKRCFREEVKK